MDNTLEDLRTRIESGEGIASREEGCRRVAWSGSLTVISLWYSRLFGDNRPQTQVAERRGRASAREATDPDALVKA